MDAVAESKLRDAIEHYATVAHYVNRSEMQRFIEELRFHWKPDPPEDYEEPVGEGYTDAGAFTLAVCRLAFGEHDPERDRKPLCEAEEKTQVLLDSFEDLVDGMGPTLATPKPEAEIQAKLVALTAALQQQFIESKRPKSEPEIAAKYPYSTAAQRQQFNGRNDDLTTDTAIALPYDFGAVMRVTDGINSAGVPAETGFTALIYCLECQNVADDVLRTYSSSFHCYNYAPIVAWRVGGSNQHRRIYYVYCRRIGCDGGAPHVWRIFDNSGPDSQEFHDDLASFLRDEAERLEKDPGASGLEQIIGCAWTNGCTFEPLVTPYLPASSCPQPKDRDMI